MAVANQVSTAALGRVAQLYKNIDENIVAASTLVICAIFATGIESDATLKDKVTFDDYVNGTTNEATNVNYARKVLTDADLVAWAPTYASDWVILDFPDQTWTAVGAAAGAWTAVVTTYDPSSSGVTATLMEMLTQHAFDVTPDGSDIVCQTPNGFFKAS